MTMRDLTRVGLAFVLGLTCLLNALLHAQEEPPAAYHGPKEKLHVYLLIGQSNMAGRAAIPESDAGVIDRCFLLNDRDQWEPAKNPFNRYSTIRKNIGMQKLNPGYSFAKTMLAKDKGIAIGLVVNAKGGTNIDQWQKGTRFYNDALWRTKEAQKTGTLKGILWHQGESNVKNPDGYLEKLKTMIVDVRTDLGDAGLPFIAGQINNAPVINDQIERLPKALSATGVASSEGLKARDRWHFDTKSIKLLGQRYAEAMLKLIAETENSD